MKHFMKASAMIAMAFALTICMLPMDVFAATSARSSLKAAATASESTLTAKAAAAAAAISSSSAAGTLSVKAAVDKTSAAKAEYIVTVGSDSSLKGMKKPAHVKSVEYADGQTALIVIDSDSYLSDVTKALKAQYPDLTIEPNYIYSSDSVTASKPKVASITDPYYDMQWGLNNDASGNYDIDYPEAVALLENRKVNYSKTVVAVIDTGFDYTHADLANCLWVNSDEVPDNGVDDDGNGFIDDYYGYDFTKDAALTTTPTASEYDHGTHCAGTIAAGTDNGIGIRGIASITGKVSLMNLRILQGDNGEGTTFDLIRAIKYAQANGADICNLSIGSYEDDSALYRVLASSDMLFVCAAGNDGYNLDYKPVYPACYNLNNVISVGNMRDTGSLLYSSNYSAKYVDVAAPGTEIWSTVTRNRYEYMDGTSMAAPFVTGIAALMHSYQSSLTASDIQQILVSTCKASSALTDKITSGGCVDAYKALKLLIPADSEAPVIAASVTPISGSYKQALKVSVTDGGDSAPTAKYARGSKTLEYFENGGGYSISLSSSGTGTKTMMVPGYYTIFAIDSSGNDAIAKVVCTSDAVSSIRLNYSAKTLYVGKYFYLKATLSSTGKYGRVLSYKSSNRSVATVSSSGKVRGLKSGTVTITVKTSNGLVAKCTVKVKK